ncbi:MAG: hypothetical protein ACR5KV_02635 [Wolbachia sp.]
MNFIINEKEINKNFIIAFQKGAKHHKSELFNSNDIYSDEIFNDREAREIDTNHSKAFVTLILKDLEKELINDALIELWGNHYKDPEIADYQKTDSYKKILKNFTTLSKVYLSIVHRER